MIFRLTLITCLPRKTVRSEGDGRKGEFCVTPKTGKYVAWIATVHAWSRYGTLMYCSDFFQCTVLKWLHRKASIISFCKEVDYFLLLKKPICEGGGSVRNAENWVAKFGYWRHFHFLICSQWRRRWRKKQQPFLCTFLWGYQTIEATAISPRKFGWWK